jgi:hypothetical protein
MLLGIVLMGCWTVMVEALQDPDLRRTWMGVGTGVAPSAWMNELIGCGADRRTVHVDDGRPCTISSPSGAESRSGSATSSPRYGSPSPLKRSVHHLGSCCWSWCCTVWMRLASLGRLAALAAPLGASWWLAGRRRAFHALAAGVPVRDATRMRWIRACSAVAFLLGVVIGAASECDVLLLSTLLVIALCGALACARASYAASLEAIEPASAAAGRDPDTSGSATN